MTFIPPSALAVDYAQASKANASVEVRAHIVDQVLADDAEATMFVATLAVLVGQAYEAGQVGLTWDAFIQRMRLAAMSS